MLDNSQFNPQRKKSIDGLQRPDSAETPTRSLHTRTNSHRFSGQKSILKVKEPETSAIYVGSRSTHATPDSVELLRTDPEADDDYSDSEEAIRSIISERRSSKALVRKEAKSYLESLQSSMQVIQTRDSHYAKKLEQRRRHIKSLLLSAFVSHSDNDYEEAFTPRQGAILSTSRPALTKANVPTIVRPTVNWGDGLVRTISIDKGEESKREVYKPMRRSDEIRYRSSKY